MNENETQSNFQSVGEDVTIWPLAKITSPKRVSIGNSVIIDDFVLITGGAKTNIGSFVHIASFVSITGGGEFSIEDFSNISTGSRILTGTDDFVGGGMIGPTLPEQYRNITRGRVHIKKHVILGANTIVLPGVTIGEGVAIGAHALITKDCEPWTVYLGIPAKPVRERPREKILNLEKQVRAEFYDRMGNYIPKSSR